MAESTLSLSRDRLRTLIGDFAGYGRTYASMNAKQQARVDESLSSGLRNFYIPSMKGGLPPHEWTFLKPVISISLIATDYDYDLPDNFISFDPGARVTYASSDNADCPIQETSEGRIRTLRQSQTITLSGAPKYWAVRPKAGTPTGTSAGQRHEIIFFPTPEQAYTVSARVKIAADVMTDTQSYPYGGMQHAETLLASCFAAFERLYNDNQTKWQDIFTERLLASIQADQQNAPASLGYNGDKSSCRHDCLHSVNFVTVNGVIPD